MRKLFTGIAVTLIAVASLMTNAGTASAHHGWNQGYNTDLVSVADRTQPFPVDQAVNTWNGGLNTVDLSYKWWDCASVNGCIMIWENPNLGAVYGAALRQYTSTGQLRGANIELNPNYAVTAQQRLKTTCHEIGHALALKDHPSAGFFGSCMRQGPSPNVVTYPDWHDFEVVNQQN